MKLFNRIRQSSWAFWLNLAFCVINLFFFVQSESLLSLVVAFGMAFFTVLAWQQDTKRLG